jgi:hypothetical protein
MEVGKTCKCYTNCGQNNHNVNLCKVKKEEPTTAMTKITSHNQNVQKNGSYARHIYGLNGHKMIDCPKFAKMQIMSQGKKYQP